MKIHSPQWVIIWDYEPIPKDLRFMYSKIRFKSFGIKSKSFGIKLSLL